MAEIIFINLILVGIVGGSNGLVPFLMPETLQFGVRIPPAHVKSSAIARVRRTYYCAWIVLMVAVIVGIVILAIVDPRLWRDAVTPIILLAVMLVLNFANYYVARQRLLAAKVAESWYEGVRETLVADTTAHSGNSGPSLTWGIPGMLVTVVSFVLPATRYAALPNKVPVHFGMDGVVDRFADKSIWSVFGTSFIELAFLIAMVVAHFSLRRFAVRLDPANPDMSRTRLRLLQREGMKAVWILMTFVDVGMLVSLLPVWAIGTGHEATFATGGMAMIILGVVVCTLWIAWAARGNRRVTPSNSNVVARDDDRFWIAGAFYFNRNDSALFIPKRFGIGATVNMAHPVAWLCLAALILLIIGASLVGVYTH